MFFFNFLFRSALNEFLKIILIATLPILNHYNTNTGKAIVDASVSNNVCMVAMCFECAMQKTNDCPSAGCLYSF